MTGQVCGRPSLCEDVQKAVDPENKNRVKLKNQIISNQFKSWLIHSNEKIIHNVATIWKENKIPVMFHRFLWRIQWHD